MGVILFNIKPFIRDKYEDPNIETKLKYVREISKEGNFSEKETKMAYRKLINNLLEENMEEPMTIIVRLNKYFIKSSSSPAEMLGFVINGTHD